MGLGETVERALLGWRRARREQQAGALGAYYRAGGDALLFRDLRVSSAQRVLDGGGFRGEWTAEALWRFGCRSVVYEPVPEFARGLRERFACNDRVEIVEAALGGAAGEIDVGLAADGSSSFRRGGPSVRARLADAAEECARLGDLGCVKLNIEGGEYDVLERLAGADLLRSTGTLLIQFHELDAQSGARRARAQEQLARTHRLRWDFPFVWERWDPR
jgi:FkbM family methyltransferase